MSMADRADSSGGNSLVAFLGRLLNLQHIVNSQWQSTRHDSVCLPVTSFVYGDSSDCSLWTK